MPFASSFERNRSGLRSHTPLTDDQIRKVAPSIFADGKHVSRSERYVYVPTIDVLAGLRKEGFEPFAVAQTRCRKEGSVDHTKHMMRLRHAGHAGGGDCQEIVLMNSHDGSSSYRMMAGSFRFVCANGMICGDLRTEVRVRHSGNVIDNVIEGATRIVEEFNIVDEQISGMKSIVLNAGEKSAFANAALALKYDTELAPAPVTEGQILKCRRPEDKSDDVWTTLNRLQENLIRGGLQSRTAAGRYRTTRPVQGIDQNVKLNRALWVLADAMAKLKS